MTIEQMNDLHKKIVELEKTLMRDLTDAEMEYLEDHTSQDFLYDVLGLEDDDIKILNYIRKLISDFFTIPDKTDDKENLLMVPEENLQEKDLDMFDSKGVDKTKVRIILNQIINELEDQNSKYIRKESEGITVTSDSYVGDSLEGSFDELESDDTEGLCSDSDNSFLPLFDLIPTSEKEWMRFVNSNEYNDIINSIVDEKIQSGESFEKIIENTDSIIADTLDELKDLVIRKYVAKLFNEKQIEIDFKDLKIEILDFLEHNYADKKICVNNNLIKILD